ncbi:MAG: lysozyme inhibitor LprI family protein [Bryobacteraceae bacterium]
MTHNLRRLLLGAALSFSVAAPAADKHSIDQRMDTCMDKDPSTHGQVTCIDQAAKEWDTELNRAYRDLTQRLNPDEKATLLAAQKAWLTYRDQEYKAIGRIYGKMEGTMYQPMRAHRAMSVVRARALELADYASLLAGR